MSKIYTFVTSSLKTVNHDTDKLRVKTSGGEYTDILDLMPDAGHSVKDGNKNAEYAVVPKIEFLGKLVNVAPVYDSENNLSSLQVYIQENRNYPEADASIISESPETKNYYLYDNGAYKPNTATWGSQYEHTDADIILPSSEGWGAFDITIGGVGDSMNHTKPGFLIPNIDSEIKVTVYRNEGGGADKNETNVVATTGIINPSVVDTETPIKATDENEIITIEGNATKLGPKASSTGRSSDTVEITDFKITVDADKLLDAVSPTGGCVTYKIELIKGTGDKATATLIYERGINKALFFGVYDSNSTVTFTKTEDTESTRTVCGETYTCEGSKVKVSVTNAKGFTGGVRTTSKLFEIQPSTAASATVINYNDSDVTHKENCKNTSSDEISYEKTFEFTGNDFNGKYTLTTKKYAGTGKNISTVDNATAIWSNVWATPKNNASTSLKETFADSDNKTLRKPTNLDGTWSWGNGEAKCLPWKDGKGKLNNSNTANAAQHIRHIYISDSSNSFYNSTRSNFSIKFDSASTWTDWSKVRILCAIKNDTNTWYAVNIKKGNFSTENNSGITSTNFDNKTTTFACELPAESGGTKGKDGIYIKIIIPKDSEATVYPYSVTFA